MTATSTSISLDNRLRHNRAKDKVIEFCKHAGIVPNGNRPFDIQIHDDRLYSRIVAEGSLGLGEAYMDGWWNCEQLDEFFYRLVGTRLHYQFKTWTDYLAVVEANIINRQSKSRAYHVGKRHYDIGNNLYRCMLDKNLIYSCGYWREASDLDAAQEAKLDLVCKKLMLEPGMRVLDIGCGWGGTAKFAAERYGVEVVGATVSEQQALIAKQLCSGLPIEIKLQDYRDIDGTFDRIYSLGMFEHVGFKNYPGYMRFIADHLTEDGLFLLHTIGANYTDKVGNAWVEKYIFPNSMLPSIAQIGSATENLLIMEDWQNFGSDYDRTLMAWFENFDHHWPSLKEGYDERFYRMWKYYLLGFAGTFRVRENQLWQIVFTRDKRHQRYDAPR